MEREWLMGQTIEYRLDKYKREGIWQVERLRDEDWRSLWKYKIWWSE